MSVSEVLLDSGAWWEILFSTPKGKRLAKRYVEAPGVRVHTSAITIGEIAAKLHQIGQGGRVRSTVAAILAFSEAHPVTNELAEEAGGLREGLRRRAPEASLADAIVLATARAVGSTLISSDPAFAGEADVRAD